MALGAVLWTYKNLTPAQIKTIRRLIKERKMKVGK